MFFVTMFNTLDLEWKKGVSMKHFFPFLIIVLILCMLLHNNSILSVSAQQHNSFASAKSLSLDHPVSISLPANATEYYYFSSLQQTTDHTELKYQITLSEADSLLISAYDDQGEAVNLKQTNTDISHWTGYINNISNNTRFFLVLHNQTEQYISTNLMVKSFTATVTPKPDNKTKKTATVKPDKKSKPTSGSQKATMKKPEKAPRHTPVSKEKHTQPPKSTARQNFNTKHAATQKPRGKSGQNSNTKTSTPIPQKISRHTSKSKKESIPNNQNTPLPTSEYYSNYPMNHSRSNLILSTHFFRMSAGYSISAFELLPINSSESEITLETMTPENLSLQNNIIYAKTPGLAVIKIYFGNDITSCTIYIQDPR